MLYNVLVVEDDRRAAQGLAALIGVLGHTVVIAYGPRMALQQLNEVIPDVIFMDINMPGIDGVEVLRFLRSDPLTADVPVIIVSGEDQPVTKQAAFDAGANDYLVKPPTLEQIEAALDKVIHLTQPEDPGQSSKPDGISPANAA